MAGRTQAQEGGTGGLIGEGFVAMQTSSTVPRAEAPGCPASHTQQRGGKALLCSCCWKPGMLHNFLALKSGDGVQENDLGNLALSLSVSLF